MTNRARAVHTNRSGVIRFREHSTNAIPVMQAFGGMSFGKYSERKPQNLFILAMALNTLARKRAKSKRQHQKNFR